MPILSAKNSDAQLIRALRRGDQRAYATLIDSYGGRIYRLVCRFINNPSDAEEITQDIFVDVFKSIGKFEERSALYTWIYRVAVNHCLKYRRKPSPEHAGLEEVERMASPTSCDPAREATRNELKDRVGAALDHLSALHREVVILHELHGLTYGECAQVLDVPLGTVKSRLSNAFRALRELLGEYVLSDFGALNVEVVGEARP